jgi:signal transduction histidine kinase
MMQDISLHILDVMENSLAAGAAHIDVGLWNEGERLHVEIRDDGCGMSEEQTSAATDPFYTTRQGKRVGLGLALFAQAARESGGSLEVVSRRGAGTAVHAVFVRTHPDCRPVGDVEGSVSLMQLSHPEVQIRYRSGASPGGGDREAQA